MDGEGGGAVVLGDALAPEAFPSTDSSARVI